MIALLSVTAVTYAAFPVHTDGSTTNTIPLDNNSSSAPDIDWGLAVACWLGGFLGIHRFMLGDTTNGILMILTLGGCGIWTLIDLINILSGKMSR